MTTEVFKYNGPTHLALSYASMKKRTTFTAQDLFNLSPKRFGHLYMVKRSLDRLLKHGFIHQKAGKYQITVQGYQHLCAISRPYRGENPRGAA